MSAGAFDRYAPFIQEYIYRKGWTDLRQVQEEAARAILDTDSHVIVASGTASGKTEAAFFPVLTALDQNPAQSIGIIYIGPLKALINDQFRRLDSLLTDSGIPVWAWHGDISQSAKKQAVKAARGVLQITPESLESLLMRHPKDVKRLFCDLRFVVIDELHALMGADRGLQLLCQLARLEKLAGCAPRRIGLSATLNDYGPAMAYLASGTGREAVAVGISGQGRRVSLCVESFVLPETEEPKGEVRERCNDFLYRHCRDKKCLIFTNSRGQAESAIADMKAIAARRGEPDIFRVHHGSVSAALRQETERALKESDGPAVAAATLTLELGIDIGDLDSTVQLGAPHSCSSFVQRLGRSGRRTGKSQMLFVDIHKDAGTDSVEALPWTLLRTIAVLQLYLEERWVEPFALKQKPFSLLAHQTLSILMSCGELTPPELARRVLLLPPFRDTVTREEYRLLLRHMLAQDLIQTMDSGTLIPGLKGEQVAGHYSFYAVFPDEESYRVIAGDSEIGTLNLCPKAGEVFTLAGRTWRVEDVDKLRKCLYAAPAQGTGQPGWTGAEGNFHDKVVRRMRQVLEEDRVYPYLMPNAAGLLAQARQTAHRLGLTRRGLIPMGEGLCILPWCGSRTLRTMEKLLENGLKETLGVNGVVCEDHWLQVDTKLRPEVFQEKLRHLTLDVEDPALVLPGEEAPRIDKYDDMVPPDLLRRAYVRNEMDIPAALQSFAALRLDMEE